MLRRAVVLLTIACFVDAQVSSTIDLTGVVPRDRARAPLIVTSSGGGAGGNGIMSQQKPFIDMTLLAVSLEPDATQPFLRFEVKVENTGTENLEFPTDPNLADFEPERPTTPYSYTSAYMPLLLELKQQGNIVLSGMTLYGSKDINGSMRTIKPNESLHIRARIPIRRASANGAVSISGGVPVRAVLLLQQEHVSQKEGSLHEKSTQIGPQVTSSNAISVPFNQTPKE
jgi:hypothetical protein